MEADSTTYDNSPKAAYTDPYLPFQTRPGNFKFFIDLTSNNGEKSLEIQIFERLQAFGLLPNSVTCATAGPECRVVSKTARVVDRVQWICESCGKRQPIRTGSFFLRLQCSMLQALQIIFAWCEDAEWEVAAQHFGVKPKVAITIYDRLDDLAVKSQSKSKLGGGDSVVLAEMYPDLLNGLSPDTTDQPHIHRILMLADTNHIPTNYQLHVIRDDLKKNCNYSSLDNQLKTDVEEVISQVTFPESTLVMGSNVPLVEGASTIQQLVQFCDAEMQHFLTSRVWRQAVTVCAASRELCAGAPHACAGVVQRYLHAALWRLRHGDGFYERVLGLLADEYTEKTHVTNNEQPDSNAAVCTAPASAAETQIGT